jgi:hypothetical protein
MLSVLLMSPVPGLRSVILRSGPEVGVPCCGSVRMLLGVEGAWILGWWRRIRRFRRLMLLRKFLWGGEVRRVNSANEAQVWIQYPENAK